MFFNGGEKLERMGEVPSTPVTLECAKLEVNERPRDRGCVEVRLTYTEYHADDSRSLEVEAPMTHKQLRRLCAALLEEVRGS